MEHVLSWCPAWIAKLVKQGTVYHILVYQLDLNQFYPRHLAVNACLAPICSVHLMAVTTVEGIGSTETKLHPVQERIAKAHGSQCGFCTPGFVMSMYTLLRNNPEPSLEEIEEALVGMTILKKNILFRTLRNINI